MTTKMQVTKAQFRETNDTKVFVSSTRANYEDSIALLRQNGLRPLTYSNALILIDRNSELKKQLQGMWFYLDGNGLKESGLYAFDSEGRFTEGKGETEKTVYVNSGENPLSLVVLTNSNAHDFERRYEIAADVLPYDVAPVVVGVKAATERTQQQFEQIGQVSVLIKSADYVGSIISLRKKGLRLLTHQEALRCLSESKELKEKLGGKEFYIKENDLLHTTGWHTVDLEGEIVGTTKEDPANHPAERRVHIFSEYTFGHTALLLYVYTGSHLAAIEAKRSLDYLAHAIVGVKDEKVVAQHPEATSALRT